MYTRRPAVLRSVPLRESDLYLLHKTSLRAGKFSYWEGKQEADPELKHPLWEITMHQSAVTPADYRLERASLVVRYPLVQYSLTIA